VKLTIVISAAVAAIAAIVAPWAALRIAALFVAFLACAYVAWRLRDITAQLPAADERVLQQARKPRDGVPADLTFLSLEIKTARANEPLRPAVLECIRDLAAARLHDRHGLSVRDPFTHTAIRPLVSDELFAIITRTSAGQPASAHRARLPRHESLPALIDEVERL
jgi:hypothetical protein